MCLQPRAELFLSVQEWQGRVKMQAGKPVAGVSQGAVLLLKARASVCEPTQGQGTAKEKTVGNMDLFLPLPRKDKAFRKRELRCLKQN